MEKFTSAHISFHHPEGNSLHSLKVLISQGTVRGGPFYYIPYSGNEDVRRELNYAIADLKMNVPELETKLMNKFYQSRLDKTIVFTTASRTRGIWV